MSVILILFFGNVLFHFCLVTFQNQIHQASLSYGLEMRQHCWFCGSHLILLPYTLITRYHFRLFWLCYHLGRTFEAHFIEWYLVQVSIEPPDAAESMLYVEKEGEPPGPAQAAFKALVPGEFCFFFSISKCQ